jgi:hypothetical protein
MNLMKIDTSLLAALFLIGTSLWARVVAQGVEQALLSTAIEWSLNGIRAGVRFFPKRRLRSLGSGLID